MTEKDVLFRKIPKGVVVDPNTFCHYGWEGSGSFAFWKFALAYYESAEALFEKFKASAGQNATLDSLGMTICFLYRHFVELSVKYLYAKFARTNDDDFKAFLNIGHNLNGLWKAVKPKISALKKRVGSSVDIGVLEHYIMEYHKFDEDSMVMRYPVKKDLSPMNGVTRLDIVNLHDRTVDLYHMFETLSYDVDNQLYSEVDQSEYNNFVVKYEELRQRMKELINELKPLTEKEDEKFTIRNVMDELKGLKKGLSQMDLLCSCTDDEIILFDTLYYTGRAINSEELRLPKNPHEAKRDVIKMCILNMVRDHLEFGKPKNEQINVYGKVPSSLIMGVQKAMDVIDWDKQQ